MTHRYLPVIILMLLTLGFLSPLVGCQTPQVDSTALSNTDGSVMQADESSALRPNITVFISAIKVIPEHAVEGDPVTVTVWVVNENQSFPITVTLSFRVGNGTTFYSTNITLLPGANNSFSATWKAVAGYYSIGAGLEFMDIMFNWMMVNLSVKTNPGGHPLIVLAVIGLGMLVVFIMVALPGLLESEPEKSGLDKSSTTPNESIKLPSAIPPPEK